MAGYHVRIHRAKINSISCLLVHGEDMTQGKLFSAIGWRVATSHLAVHIFDSKLCSSRFIAVVIID